MMLSTICLKTRIERNGINIVLGTDLGRVALQLKTKRMNEERRDKTADDNGMWVVRRGII